MSEQHRNLPDRFSSDHLYNGSGRLSQPAMRVVRNAGLQNGARDNGPKETRAPLFAGLSPADYARTVAAARFKEFTRGEMLYIESDPVQQVLLVTTGSVKITKLGRSGTEVILKLGVAGDILGVGDQFASGRHCASAQGFRSGTAIIWEPQAFKTLVSGLPALHQNIVRILGQDLLELQERFREIATKKAGARVARQLVRLTEKIGQPANGGVEVLLSREELAQMTGTTLFTVSRLLSAWKVRGLVRSRREAVVICNVQLLRAMSNDAEIQEQGASA